MEKISDIQVTGTSQPLKIETKENKPEFSPEKPSPYVLNIAETIKKTGTALKPFHLHRQPLIDIATFTPRKLAAAGLLQKTIFVQPSISKRRHTFDKRNFLKLATVILIIAVLINTINVYYKAQNQKQQIIQTAYEGFRHIIQGGTRTLSSNLDAAQHDFDQASAYFKDAENKLWFLKNDPVLPISRQTNAYMVNRMFETANHITQAGKTFSRAMAVLNQHMGNANSTAEKSASITDELKLQFLPLIDQTIVQIRQAESQLALIPDSSLPQDKRTQFVETRTKLKKLLASAETLRTYVPAVLKLMGDRYPHRYMLMFLNSNEPRPVMGFFGSYGILDLNDGHLEKLEVHDVYENDGQLHEIIPAPEDIQKLSKNWGMRDSNYSSDFPISARKADWFLQKEKGPSTDSIIAMDLDFAAKLLELTGPIRLERFEKPITKDNFIPLLQYVIESKVDGLATPKQIMSELIPKVQERIVQEKKFAQIFQLISQAVAEKHLMAYSKDQEIQEFFNFIGADGITKTPAEKQDYLQVVYTSIGGNKSFAWIEESLNHQTTIGPDGRLIDELTITQTHTWNRKNEAQLEKLVKEFGYKQGILDQVKDILGRSPSKVMARVYVPKGSILLSTQGIDKNAVKIRQDDELGLTYFLVEMEVAPHIKKNVSVKYELPFSLDVNAHPFIRLGAGVIDTYDLIIQKRSGSRGTIFKKEISLDEDLKFYQPNDTSSASSDSAFIEEQILNTDHLVSQMVGVR